VSNSLSDSWQASNIMALGCNPAREGGCPPAKMAYLLAFREQMLAALAPVLAPGSRHGGFLQGCFVHVVEDVTEFSRVRVPSGLAASPTQAAVLAAWLAGNASAPRLSVDTFPPWTNPSCNERAALRVVKGAAA